MNAKPQKKKKKKLNTVFIGQRTLNSFSSLKFMKLQNYIAFSSKKNGERFY
jgi:serine protease inhibitor ecotin